MQELVTKVEGQAEAVRVWNYPFEALEELLANCIYHRNYQEREPVTIRVEPDAIYIYNLGGPDRAIRIEDFQKGRVFPQRYRNKRVGDFLKELDLTKGRATGIPVVLSAMQNNGSPTPVFETDEDRTWFRVMLPIHPAFTQLAANKPIDKISNGRTSQMVSLVSSLVNSLVSDFVGSEKVYEGMGKILFLLSDHGSQSRSNILRHLNLSNQTNNYKIYIEPLEKAELIEKTLPERPQSPNQKYRLTEKGRSLLLIKAE